MEITLDRRPAVEAASGKRRSQLYADVTAGLFPPPVKIGPRAAAWVRSEYQQVLAARVAGKSDDQIRELVAALVAQRGGRMMSPRRDEARLAAGFEGTQNSSIAPTLSRPRAGTVKASVADALLAGERITSLQAWARWGTSRLAGLIHQLRREGWPIDSEDVVVETGHGHTAHVARYCMGARRGH